MYTRISFFGSVLAATMSFSAPATAQSVDTAQISIACATSSDACLVAVRAAIAALRAAGLSPAAMNAQLGVIAGAAVSASASMAPAERLRFASVLNEIGAASTNAAQKQAIARLASAIASGQRNIDLVAVASALSAS